MRIHAAQFMQQPTPTTRVHRFHVYVVGLCAAMLLFWRLHMQFIGFSSQNTPATYQSDTNSRYQEIIRTPRMYGDVCDAAQKKRIAAADVNIGVLTNCPSRKYWMDVVLKHSADQPEVAIVSVGCNKGDDFVALLEAWSGNSTYSVSSYLDVISEMAYMHANKSALHVGCPSEGPIIQSKKHLQTTRPVRGICVEPVPVNVRLITDAARALQFETSREFKVIQAAVDTFPGTVPFPNVADKPGVEDLGLFSRLGDSIPTVAVEVLNLDTLFARENLSSKIDLLSIDTEGNDARVIIGMGKTLAKGDIRVFEFEYHEVGNWARDSLENIVDWVDIFGYDCFWQGNNAELWRLTGCWLPRYGEARRWSNVVCVNRGEKAILADFARFHLDASVGG